ncbi:MAG: hypothetical protein ABW153_18410 [Sedimenticola sp.]
MNTTTGINDPAAAEKAEQYRLDHPGRWQTVKFEKDPQITAVGREGDFIAAYVGVGGFGQLDSDSAIFIQKFNKDGDPKGEQIVSNIHHWPGQDMVPLIMLYGRASDPQVTAVGEDGAFVLTYSARDEGRDRVVVVQRYGADGQPEGEQVRLQGSHRDGAWSGQPKVTAIGFEGAFAIAFTGTDDKGDNAIFVQRFDAPGKPLGEQVHLEATGVDDQFDGRHQIEAIGSDGAFVVTYVGNSGLGYQDNYAIYVQRFDASGRPEGEQIRLESGVVDSWYSQPQVSAVGSDGEFVVTYCGRDKEGDLSVHLQGFNSQGEPAGQRVLEAAGMTGEGEFAPQITSIGDNGAYVLTCLGKDKDGENAIIIQRFDSSGEPTGEQHQLKIGPGNGIADEIQITPAGDDGAFAVTYVAGNGCHINDHELASVHGLFPGDRFENAVVIHTFDTIGSYVGMDLQSGVPGCSFDGELVDVAPIGGEAGYAMAYVAESEEGGSSIFVDTFGVPVPDVPVYDPALVSGLNTTSNGEFTVATSEEGSRILFKSKGVNWTGSYKDEIVVSDEGDDYLIGNGGYDLIDAGGGDDTIILNGDNIAKLEEGVFALEPAHIDGGAGSDRLMLIDASLDFTALADDRIVDIEIFDLKTDSGVNELTITEQAVNNLLGDENGAIRIKGRGGGLVHTEGFSDSGVDRVYEGIHYDVYTLNSATLWIDQAIAHVVV